MKLWTDDGRTPDHGHPISSPGEPNGSGELISSMSFLCNGNKTKLMFKITEAKIFYFLFLFFLNSVLAPFQNYFSSYETGQSVVGRKRENPEKNHLARPQAELGLSHMWPVRGSNPHQTQR